MGFSWWLWLEFWRTKSPSWSVFLDCYSAQEALGSGWTIHNAEGCGPAPRMGGDTYMDLCFQAHLPSRVPEQWEVWSRAHWLCGVDTTLGMSPTWSGGAGGLTGAAVASLLKRSMDQRRRWRRAACPSRTIGKTARSPWPCRSSG